MKKFLIVDDEDLIRHSLSAALKNKDVAVITAANRETALKAINEDQFDLCLLDMHLPDINGLEIMRKLRDVSPRTRIIIMTGGEVTDSIMKSIREYAHCLISKPFVLEQVRSLVDRVLSIGKSPTSDGRPGAVGVSCVCWISDDNRKHLRKPIDNSITCYAVAPRNDMAATLVTVTILDISETGMGILTESNLELGHLIRLSDAPIHGRGVIRWSVPTGTAQAYRAGIQFVSPENIPH
jgi:DNA-binding NarL/FixJ family response regulator